MEYWEGGDGIEWEKFKSIEKEGTNESKWVEIVKREEIG